MDVTYNVDRQNMAGYYLKNIPLASGQPEPRLPPECPMAYPQTAPFKQMQGHHHGQGHNLPDIPYPPVKVRRPNPAYACMLQRAYTGQVSEFTAIAQYFYHHVMLKECYPEASKILEEIMIQEMRHLEMLAECIVKLGGDPVLAVPKGRCPQWWRGDIPDYSKYLQLMILKDIQAEYAAIAEYQRIIRCIDDECVIALLERIILDEEEHIRLLKGILEWYWADKK